MEQERQIDSNELNLRPELLELIQLYAEFLIGHKVPCTFQEWYNTFKVG